MERKSCSRSKLTEAMRHFFDFYLIEIIEKNENISLRKLAWCLLVYDHDILNDNDRIR